MNEEVDDLIDAEEDESSYFSNRDGVDNSYRRCRFSYLPDPDPEPSLCIMCHDDFIEEVNIIGDSLNLKVIDITLCHSGCGDNVVELFQGLSLNRSIELVQLWIVDDVTEPEPDISQVLIPFFEHNDNLRCMEIYQAMSWILKSLSLALSACKNSQLKRLNLIEILALDTAEFFGSLSTIHFLTELCIERTYDILELRSARLWATCSQILNPNFSGLKFAKLNSMMNE